MRVKRRFVGSMPVVVVLLVAVITAGAFVVACDGGEDEATTTTTTTAAVVEETTTTVAAASEKTLAAGESWEVAETTSFSSLTIGEGATITAPEGKSVTLIVDGIETGQILAETAGYDLVFMPGTYTGEVVLTVTDANMVPYEAAGPPGAAAEPIMSPFRQAICVEDAGLSESKSVLAAVLGGTPSATGVEAVSINSTGECFNAVYAAGDYTLTNVEINLSGNARSDFSGYGAAVVGTGEGTTLVLDDVTILTDGVARAGVVATNGANVIVKNSDIETNNGEMPADYIPTIDTAQMRSVPWMLGLSGNVRATNLLGTNTRASYINSRIASEGWGALSTDGCTTPTLTVINSVVEITGEDGYGSYGIGDATEYFLGCTMNVGTYATISRGSFLYYGDSDPAKVAELNTQLEIGLTEEELAAIPDVPTVVNSNRFGVMWHGGGTLDISGGTVFNTKEAVFLDKGQAIKITVDGSEGVQLNPDNGVIMQFMDDDDPGPDFTTMQNTNNYVEPTEPVEKDTMTDLARVSESDAVAVFKNITLTGDFYNSTRGGMAAPMGPPPGGAPPADAGAAPAGDAGAAPAGDAGAPPADAGAAPAGDAGAAPAEAAATEMVSNSKNLCLTFDKSSITGVITASTAKHDKATITPEEYYLLGRVTNTPAPAVNNGVVVMLQNASAWTVTGTSYITSLTIGDGCTVAAPAGKTLIMKVDGAETPIAPGAYKGAIELIVQ